MSKHETADDYAGLVVALNKNWRVVAGSCGIQWLMQKRSGDQWLSKMFFHSRAGLLLYAMSFEVDAEPEAVAVLEAPPEKFPEAVREPRKQQQEA